MSGSARATWWYLGLGAAVMAASPMLPAAGHQVVFVCAGLSVIGAILVGLRRHRPAWRRPWLFLVASVCAGMLASLWWAIDLAVFGERLFPSGGDVVYNLVLPLLMVSILGWTRPASRAAAGSRRRSWRLAAPPWSGPSWSSRWCTTSGSPACNWPGTSGISSATSVC